MRVNLKEGAVVKSRGVYRLGAKNKHLFMELLTNSARLENYPQDEVDLLAG